LGAVIGWGAAIDLGATADPPARMTGAGLLTITGTEAGPLGTGAATWICGRLIAGAVAGAALVAAVGVGCESDEFIRYTPPNAAAPTTASPATTSRPLPVEEDCATGASTGTGRCIGAGWP
jgi:hypothetical protein